MISQERVDFIQGETALHHHNEFEKVQVNLEWGPLMKDSLVACKRHYDELVSSPDALIVGYRFTINFQDPSYYFTTEHSSTTWFSQISQRLRGVGDNETASSTFLREAIKNNGVRCFWNSFAQTDGSGIVKVYIVVTGSQKDVQDDIETFHKDVTVDLWRSCSLTSSDFSGLHEECSFFTSFGLKSSITLVSPQDGSNEMLKALLFYKLSALSAIPADINENDLVSSAVITNLIDKPKDKGRVNLEAMYSSARNGEKSKDKWQTPPEVFAQLDKQYGFTLDAAAEPETALCLSYFTEEDDALKQDWSGHIVFCNPPYSKLKAFAKKAYEESLKGTIVVMLVPARTDTIAFHEYLSKGEVRFIRGRLKFLQNGQVQDAAPFPSMICVLGPSTEGKWEYVEKDNLTL
ncbi:phage N-6-adenine-methyltransferase [Vibrio chagasii]|uniref:phage N-6-adenine-methyltransferase n=1 Tax=Vibrio chagasii TaxID=170679 RepID=UPI003735B0DA